MIINYQLSFYTYAGSNIIYLVMQFEILLANVVVCEFRV